MKIGDRVYHKEFKCTCTYDWTDIEDQDYGYVIFLDSKGEEGYMKVHKELLEKI